MPSKQPLDRAVEPCIRRFGAVNDGEILILASLAMREHTPPSPVLLGLMPPYSIPRRTLNEPPAPINWRRGMFRVWVLVTIAWMMGWIIYLIIFGLQGGFKEEGEYLVVPVVLIGPPLALLLVGAAAAWAFRGFKPDVITQDN